MSKSTLLGKILRIIGIVLLGLTAVFTLLGGIGSTCLAFRTAEYAAQNPEKWGPLVPYAWLYQLLSILAIVASLYALYATVLMVRSKPGAYRHAVISIIACLAVAFIQMTASRLLRGSSQPNDMRVYLSLVTLGVFLLFSIPGVRRQMGEGNPQAAGALSSGLALFVAGVSVLAAPVWAGAAHTVNGINYAGAFGLPLAASGWALLLGSLLPFGRYLLSRPETEAAAPAVA